MITEKDYKPYFYKLKVEEKVIFETRNLGVKK